MTVGRLITLKQIAERAWVEEVSNDETLTGEVDVKTYRETGAVALHAGLVVEVGAREKDSPHE